MPSKNSISVFACAGLLHKCRYSLGSIALWTRAEQVELVNPYSGLTLTTKKHFSYYKFFLPENVDSFQLTLANCTVQIHLKVCTGRQLFGSGRIFSIWDPGPGSVSKSPL